MLEKLAGIAVRYDEIERMMGDTEIASDYERVGELNKERTELQPIIDAYNQYLKQQSDLLGECHMEVHDHITMICAENL